MNPLPVFVVACSGRCGSTLLSELLGRHPQVLSISEFLVPLVLSGVRHANQAMTAAEFCDVLQNRMPTTSALLKAGIAVPEFRYPFHRAGARYRSESGVPFLANGALSHLTDDPDPAFDHVLERLLAADGAVVGDHLACVFQTLAEMFGGAVVVERSGGSLVFAAEIGALLPQASMILLTRSGPETALSMSRHAYFRHIVLRTILTQALRYDPYVSERRDGVSGLPAILQDQLPERFSKAGFAALDLPVPLFGALWSRHTVTGLSGLPRWGHHLTFEQLCADPRACLSALADGLGVDADPAWLGAAAERVGPLPQRSDSMTEEERAFLCKACEPGEMALAKRGIM